MDDEFHHGKDDYDCDPDLSPHLSYMTDIIQEENYYLITCPHCQGIIQIYKHEIQCKVFRHGIYKHNGNQMNPHTPKEECDKVFHNQEIYGCGKPFRFDGKHVTICDYI